MPYIFYRYVTHCVKSVQIRSFFWSVFSYIWTEYRKIQIRKNSLFGHFSRSEISSVFSPTLRRLSCHSNDRVHSSVDKVPEPCGMGTQLELYQRILEKLSSDDVTGWLKTITINILTNIKRIRRCGGETIPRPFSKIWKLSISLDE